MISQRSHQGLFSPDEKRGIRCYFIPELTPLLAIEAELDKYVPWECDSTLLLSPLPFHRSSCVSHENGHGIRSYFIAEPTIFPATEALTSIKLQQPFV